MWQYAPRRQDQFCFEIICHPIHQVVRLENNFQIVMNSLVQWKDIKWNRVSESHSGCASDETRDVV